MIKIAICDDEKIYTDVIYNYLYRFLKEECVDAEITKYNSSEELGKAIEKTNYDVLFLDIDMPGLSGFDISAMLRKRHYSSLIIFISAKDELVYDSFEYTPFYFISKNRISDLGTELEHITSKLMSYFKSYHRVSINDTANGVIIEKVGDISFIKSEKHYLVYHMAYGKRTYTERSTIDNAENAFEQFDFLRTHQRYLVNPHHISRFLHSEGIIYMNSGDKIPLSRAYRKDALDKFTVFRRG